MKKERNGEVKSLRYWIVKSSPDEYSVEEFERDKTTSWTGVRNYQARNNLTSMKKGDTVFFYYSQVTPPGIVAECTVAKVAYPDPTQFESRSEYFDPNSPKERPRWVAVDLKFKRRYPVSLSINEMKTVSELKHMPLFKSSRLSVQPVSEREAGVIFKLLSK